MCRYVLKLALAASSKLSIAGEKDTDCVTSIVASVGALVGASVIATVGLQVGLPVIGVVGALVG